MKRLSDREPCTYGREITLRMTRQGADALFTHLRQDMQQEQMAFAVARQSRTAAGTVFLAQEVILPDRDDLQEQSAAGICPTKDFQSHVYRSAYRSKSTIVEFHTHPGESVPDFSGIDEAYAHPNAEFIADRLPEPVTLMMIVGNNRFDAFDGVIYDRHRHDFRQLDRFEVLGRPTNVWSLGEEYLQHFSEELGLFDRQRRIPGWNQDLLERQRIGIFGAGGNGAPLLQTLLAIGAGRRGFIAIADHDVVEDSNLPRIPYGLTVNLQTPKVTVAAHYAALKSPSTPLYAFPCRFDEKAVRDRMKMATVLFHCGDSDGGRKEINEFAVRYGIPLIDLGCDVQVSDRVIAGGQVRLVLPGDNACLLCCGAFDPAQAAMDQMSDAARARQANHGYVRGATAEATPSVANLNGLTAQHAVSQFLALVNGGDFAQWDYLHFDQFNGRTIPARTSRHEACPLCGPLGCLSEGDSHDDALLLPPSINLVPQEPHEHSEPTGTPSSTPLSEYPLVSSVAPVADSHGDCPKTLSTRIA